MSRPLLAVFWLGLALWLGGAPVARADKATARKLTVQATRDYKLGHFQQALDEFSKAYEQFPAPLLLFNIGQCQRELGNDERAVFFLRNYLHDSPQAKNRPLVEDLIAECEAKLAAKAAEVRRREEEEQQKRTLEMSENSLLSAQPAVPPPPVLTVGIDVEGLRGRERAGEHMVIAGLTVAAAGAVAVALGGYFGTRVSSDTSTLNQVAQSGGTWSTKDAATESDGNRSALIADTLYAAGGAALIAGGILALVGWRQSASATAALSVAVLPTGHGTQAEVAWNF